MEIHGGNYEIEVRVTHQFEAQHALPSRPELHSHLWEVEIGVCGPLNPETGMVCDMLVLADFFRPYIQVMDGKNLHEISDFLRGEGLVGLAARYPTCDTLAHYFLWKILPDFRAWPGFEGLRISEVKVGIHEPGHAEAWGHAVIRPKAGENV